MPNHEREKAMRKGSLTTSSVKDNKQKLNHKCSSFLKETIFPSSMLWQAGLFLSTAHHIQNLKGGILIFLSPSEVGQKFLISCVAPCTWPCSWWKLESIDEVESP